ncbi:MAG TPA: hypothetical protein VH934_19945 [Xanthobacteraceae bacterium]|jgi:hypothetical protein
MDEIFRFLFLRPPAPAAAVTVQPSVNFARELASADTASNRKEAQKAVAATLVASARNVGALTDLGIGKELVALETALADIQDPTPAQVTKAIKDVFGKTPAQVAKLPAFAQDRDRLSDNLIAAKLLSRDGPVEAKRLEALLRLMALIERVAADEPALKDPGAVRSALQKSTALGTPVAAPSKAAGKDNPPSAPPDNEPHRQELRDRIQALEGLVTSLTHVAPTAFAVPAPPETPIPAASIPAPAVELLRAQLVDKIRAGPVERIQVGPIHAVAAELASVQSTMPQPVAAQPAAARLVLTAQAVEALPESHRATLKTLGIDVTKIAIPSALGAAQAELRALHTQLAELEPGSVRISPIGSRLYELDKLIGKLDPATWPKLPPGVPMTHGTIQPVGVGDLLVVRQQLKRYEGGEIGYIENVLKGEFKKRVVSRERTTEETTTVEVETTKEEERDNQSTERFELQREASQVVKEDSSFKAGLSISGSYGPTVDFKASTDFSMNNAKEEATKTASKYSKEVTSRATTKVTERVRTQQVLRTLEVFKESDEHGVDNSKGSGHVVGIYQWLDKVYEAQVFNYGKRMMFDVMVPEPAAFWIYANSNKPRADTTLSKPAPFTLTPAQINEANYPYYVEKYQVSGVKPPPEPYQTISKTFDGTATHDDHNGTKVAEIPIPDGYRAVTGHAVSSGSVWDDWRNNWQTVVAVGKQVWIQSPGSYVNHYFTLDNEQASVPLGIRTYGLHFWMTTVEVDCQRTDRAYHAWQLDTHTAIMQGYLQLERNYQDELAALTVQSADEIKGRNPLDNRTIERTELKKHTISMFTAQAYDAFGAISNSSQGYPEPWLARAEAEGKYIRFFEEAFEWEQMTYLFYPYYWGRKVNWPNRALLQDSDPQFAEFLKAGSARVVVPVRPGFEAALAHFMDTGEIWEGADPPTLTSPLYVSIIDEIKERTQAPGDEVAQGGPWDVRLPTTLVRLRPDDSLPTWSKQADGSWLPA